MSVKEDKDKVLAHLIKVDHNHQTQTAYHQKLAQMYSVQQSFWMYPPIWRPPCSHSEQVIYHTQIPLRDISIITLIAVG